jgi:hypothetical protein
MNYIELNNVPEGKLPIYFCNAKITIEEVKSYKKRTYNREIEKVVLKGLNEGDLVKDLQKKYSKDFLQKKEIRYSKVKNIEIYLIKYLGFGVFE